MTAARKRAFNGSSASWRNGAIASIQINWKRVHPDLSSDESRDLRLWWIEKYLDLPRELKSMTDLSDSQLGTVAGELKRLTGQTSGSSRTSPTGQTSQTRTSEKAVGNVVPFPIGIASADVAPNDQNQAGETIFLASHEQVFTLDKLDSYIKWTDEFRKGFLTKRFKCASFRMLTFKQATSCTNQLLNIAAHRDLKIRNDGKGPISRAEIKKYIPILKRELRIDQLEGKR